MLSTSPPNNSQTPCFLESIYTSYFQLFSHLPTLLHQQIAIIALNYERVTGQLYEYNEKCLKLTTGQEVAFDDIRYVLCRSLRLRFILDNFPQICKSELGDHATTLQSTASLGVQSFGLYQQEKAYVKNPLVTTSRHWRRLPRELTFECMKFSRDFPDVLVWRLVSSSFNAHLKKSFKTIDCFNMKSVGGKSWRLEKKREGCGMDRLISYFEPNQIQSIVFPRENYISQQELELISKQCKSLKKITFQFASRSMEHIFGDERDTTIAPWSESVQEIEFVALYLNKKNLHVSILNTMQDRFPNLKQLTLDFCKYESRHLRALQTRLRKDVRVVCKPHSKALSRLTGVEMVKYALKTLCLDPNMPFEEIYSSGLSRATSLLDIAVTRAPHTKRLAILEYLIQNGASIRESISRIGWWHTFTYPLERRQEELGFILHLCEKYQDSRLFQPCMFRSLTKLEGIDVMTEETVASVFKDIPSRFFHEQEFLFEAVTFTSPHYRDLFVRILRENMHDKTNSFFSNETTHRFDSLISLSICNTSFVTEEDIFYMISFPFDAHLVLEDGNTYLHLAASHRRLNLAVKLIEQFGANVNEDNLYGETPLHMACQLEDLDFAGRLVRQYGADVTRKNNRGQTPHEIALCTRSHYQSDVSKCIPQELIEPEGRGEQQASFLERQFPQSTSTEWQQGPSQRDTTSHLPRAYTSSIKEPALKRTRFEKDNDERESK
uniref:Uncharacterized protein n=1 Tax=Percolomonas cosmopolitus TaxID=63605 RepID=A0A7S1KN63_9EUKA|mmetsp:Transcript_10638/g.39696  ORF Transcript_10638/g.39696 Transcript_10638/m.39696 type:complete len:721 (+) Transcript_10638:185-2347(+)